MKKCLLLLPGALIGLTGCNPIQQMTCLVNQSTAAVYCNIQMAERATEAVRENTALIERSNKALEANAEAVREMRQE